MSQRLLCQQWAEGSMYLCGIYFPLEGVPVYYLLGQTTYHIHVCANTCSCTCMAYTYMHTYIYIYICTYMQVCVYTCVYIYIYMSIFGGSFVNPKLLDPGPRTPKPGQIRDFAQVWGFRVLVQYRMFTFGALMSELFKSWVFGKKVDGLCGRKPHSNLKLQNPLNPLNP